MEVPCLDGLIRPYRDLDCAASTPALQVVADRVDRVPPVVLERAPGRRLQVPPGHGGLRGGPGQHARVRRAGPRADGNVVVLVRNTTEAINHLAYRLRLGPDDVVATTVVEHHANLLPWARVAQRRWVECERRRHLRPRRRHRRARRRAAAGAAGPDRRLQRHRMAATGRRHLRGGPRPRGPGPARCRPAGPAPTPPLGTRLRRLQRPQALRPLRRRRAHRAARGLRGPATRSWPAAARWTWSTWTRSSGPSHRTGRRPAHPTSSAPWPSAPPWTSWAGSAGTPIGAHEHALSTRLHDGLRAIDGVHVLGPGPGTDTLSVASFTVDGMHHALVAARLSAEWGIGVRHGCFCAHPYLLRLLGVGPERRGRGPGGRAARRPQRHPRRRAGQLRAGHLQRRRRRAARGIAPAGRWCTGTRAIRAGRRHGRLLARGPELGGGATTTAPRCRLCPWVSRCSGWPPPRCAGLLPHRLRQPKRRRHRPRHLAWVTTDASVTLPGTAITPVNLSTDQAERGVQVGSLPSAMAFTKNERPAGGDRGRRHAA